MALDQFLALRKRTGVIDRLCNVVDAVDHPLRRAEPQYAAACFILTVGWAWDNAIGLLAMIRATNK